VVGIIPLRYRLRTLLILLAVGPPVLAVGWDGYRRWSFERQIAPLGFSEIITVTDEDWAKLTTQRRHWRCTPLELREPIEMECLDNDDSDWE
jgi:hypothetical protein